MTIIQILSVLCFALFGVLTAATPLDDSTLADQALAIIGARVPNTTQKCSGCHQLNASKLRMWFSETSRVTQECLAPWHGQPTPTVAESTLACLSINAVLPYQWAPRKLALWSGRVDSADFDTLFAAKFGNESAHELTRFRQRNFMPRSGAPGFNDTDWSIVQEYIARGAPLLDDKLAAGRRPAPVTPATIEDVVLLDDLSSPWAVVPSPDGQIWITESDGQLKIYNGQYKLISTLSDFPDLKSVGQGGLLDIAFHPQYLQNGWVYFAYTVGDDGYHTQVNRFTYRNGQLSERKMIIDGPTGTDGAHFGSRLVFDDAGFLYATFGERHQKEKAQSLNSLHGKTVRLHDDGRIPADNPFPKKSIYTLGHRNPQGLAIHPVSKKLVVSEHGPTGYDAPGGGDEVNILKPGANYGWPVIHHRQTRRGMEAPLQEYTPSIAPSGIAFYSGAKIPQWKNDLFVTGLAGAALFRLTIDANDRLVNEEKLLEDKYGRLRDVTEAPDGSLLVISSGGQLIQLRAK